MLDQRRLANLPWGMVALVATIVLVGITAVYSATYTPKGPSSLYYKQLIWVGMGLIVMFCALLVDYHTVGRYAYVLYTASLLLLVLVMVTGKTGMGAQRWLAVGPFVFQPSELAKIALTLALARYFAEDPKRGNYDLRDLAIPAVMVMIPLVLVMKQPDLGTALMLLFTSSLIVMIAGIRLRAIMVVVLIGATIASAVFLVTPSATSFGGRSSRISRTGSRRLSIRARTRAAAATTQTSPKSRWGPASSRARASAKAPRARWHFCRNGIRTSSSRSLPRSADWSAPDWCSLSTYCCCWWALIPPRTQRIVSACSWRQASYPCFHCTSLSTWEWRWAWFRSWACRFRLSATAGRPSLQPSSPSVCS